MRLYLPLAILMSAAPALATTAVRAELAELVTESDLVLLGTAGEPVSSWQGSRIVTRVPITVDEIWAGETHETTVEITTLGGVVDDIGQNVSGALSLHRGEQLVLCLQRHGGRLRVVEMSQGAFFVAPSPSTADPAVRRRSFGLRLLGPVLTPMPVTLRALERAVREADHARR